MLARDVMSKDVVFVRPQDKVEKVAKILVDNQISGAPVVDDNGRLAGIVTEKDLMVKAKELRIPFYITLFDSIIFLENPIKFKEDLRKYIAVKVEDVMTRKVVAVEEDTEVARVAELMSEKEINRVPVVRHGRLVGIITRNDVLKSLVKHNE